MMAKPTVLHLGSGTYPPLLRILDAKYSCFKWWEVQDKEAFLADKGPSIKGVITLGPVSIDEDLISRLPNLEIISSFSAGVDRVDLDFCKQRGVVVTNTPDVVTDDTADIAMVLLLATLRRTCAADRFVREGRWMHERYPLTTKVTGKRIGIVGLGRIGQAIAKRAVGFNCSVSYCGRSEKIGVPYRYYDSIVDLAKDSDILIPACPLTKETTGLVSREVLDALGPNGYLVNISRGRVVDEAELVRALVEGRLAGAGLDVFEKEPHVPEELLKMDNVVLQPHLGPATLETLEDMVNLLVANLEAHFSGKPVPTPVS